jgi:hypothetical protein
LTISPTCTDPLLKVPFELSAAMQRGGSGAGAAAGASPDFSRSAKDSDPANFSSGRQSRRAVPFRENRGRFVTIDTGGRGKRERVEVSRAWCAVLPGRFSHKFCASDTPPMGALDFLEPEPLTKVRAQTCRILSE